MVRPLVVALLVSAGTPSCKSEPRDAGQPRGAPVALPPGLPSAGVVEEIQQGDLACYLSVRDPKGKAHQLMADFALCERPKAYLKRRVRLAYRSGNINDCESSEPCGKTKRVQLVHRLAVLP